MSDKIEKHHLLNDINVPADLRKLKVSQLPEVCKELRDDIIKEVSCNPGHFAASLGTVELTVALHYVFQTYHPEIIYHAAAHKHVPLMEESPNEAIKNNGRIKQKKQISLFNMNNSEPNDRHRQSKRGYKSR